MELDEKQVGHLKEVVSFIIEFESADYDDWCRDTDGRGKENHVYYHAERLFEELELTK